MFLLIEFESTDEAGPTSVEDVKQETLRRLKKAVTSAVEHRGTWEAKTVEACDAAQVFDLVVG